MLAQFTLLPTCDETNRAAGLSVWWSRREQPVQRGTLCLYCGLKVETTGNFIWPCFRFFMRVQRVSQYPEEVQAGSLARLKQVIVAWCYGCVARGCARYGMYVRWMRGIVVVCGG